MNFEILSEFGKIREQNPMLFLDYDGTLVPIITDPDLSYPDEGLIKILDHLSGKYELYIVTGRSLREIRNFLGNRYNLIALHGAIISRKGGKTESVADFSEFKEACDRIYNQRSDFEKRYPGVKIMNKDGGIVFTKWHLDPSKYRDLEVELGKMAEKVGMSLYLGKMIVELRIPGINKGDAIRRIRNGRPALIAGDDHTDEDAFKANPDAISVKVGDGASNAKFNVEDYLKFRELLSEL